MHCNQCGTIVPADRTECPVCGLRMNAGPGSDFSQPFGKHGIGANRQMRLVEPPPKKPSAIRVGIVVAVIGAALLIAGVILAIVIPYVVSDGGGAELIDWAKPTQRQEGDSITLYLTISKKTSDTGGYIYEFEEAGNTQVFAYSDIGDAGDSVIATLTWGPEDSPEIDTCHSPWAYRIPGILVCVVALTLVTVGLVVFVTARNRYKKQLDEYNRSFSKMAPLSIAPGQDQAGAPPSAQPTPAAPSPQQEAVQQPPQPPPGAPGQQPPAQQAMQATPQGQAGAPPPAPQTNPPMPPPTQTPK